MRLAGTLVFVVLAGLALGLGGRDHSVGADGPSAGTRVSWQGGSWFLYGANLPWFNWACDFGCGGAGGVSDPSVNAQVDTVLGQARDAGVHTVRWWVFEGDAWQIARDSNGVPAGLKASVYVDFDAALHLAETYNLYFDFVLFSAPTAIPGGWLTDAGQRSALVAALTPLFARYSGNPRVLSWEVFNEPEWDIWSHKIDGATVQATVKAVTAAVHKNSTALATVGSATLDGLSMWVGLGLDYYQAHWYDSMSSGSACAICRTYDGANQQYGIDAPLVIGEFYLGPEVDGAGRLNTFYAAGYAGTWAWSLLPDHTQDHLRIDMAALRAFASQHADVGPRPADRETAFLSGGGASSLTNILLALTPAVFARSHLR